VRNEIDEDRLDENGGCVAGEKNASSGKGRRKGDMGGCMFYPTVRKPEDVLKCLDWFGECAITVGDKTDTPERRMAATRVLYTWRDCFAGSIRGILQIDLVVHRIPLRRGAQWRLMRVPL
jgi:hypothetical protein